jgi:hypothetical protein
MKFASTRMICILILATSTVSGVSQKIDAIDPANASIGQRVKITGTGFSATATDNTVTFSNGVVAAVVSSTTTTIETVVPSGAISGPVTVTVAGAKSPDYLFIVNDQQFAIAASFVSSIGPTSQVYAQPNIVASSNWTINNSAISFRVTGLFTNKDTSRYVNATNIFKPEVANISLKLSVLQRIRSDPKSYWSKVGIGGEANIYSQTLQSIVAGETSTGSVTSLLTKIGVQWAPADGLLFYFSKQFVNNMTGVATYVKKFGEISNKFSNYEIAGMYRIQDGALKGLYFQPSVILADGAIHDLLRNQDSAIVLIRIGYTAGF